MMNNPNAALWLWLQRVLGPGSARFRELLRTYSYIEDIYENRDSAEMARLLTPAEYRRSRTLLVGECRTALEACADKGIEVLCYTDESYPERLRQTHIPPMLLFATGDVSALKTTCVAGVGARYDTAYGRRAVRKLCEPIARSGVTLVSGLAYGTDANVHRAALEAGGRTIAVLGNPIDTTYPPENCALRVELERTGGCTVSEYEPGTPMHKGMFPQRNRIISGLSAAVIIFEAAKRSGTMITANWALDDGREVFAVPGEITSSQSEGTNYLIKQGASPATEASDVLDSIGVTPVQTELSLPGGEPKVPMSAAGKKICAALRRGDLGLDELMEATRLPAHELLSELTMMEIDGVTQTCPGPKYKLVSF